MIVTKIQQHRQTRACRGYLAESGTQVGAQHGEIAATERGNDGGVWSGDDVNAGALTANQ